MEAKFVSEDVQIMIVELLEPRDIYSFGSTCKSALRITGKVWKKKTIKEFPKWCDKSVVKIVFPERVFRWYKFYVGLHIKSFNTKMFEFIAEINSSTELRKKGRIFEKLLQHMVENIWIIKLVRTKNIKNVLQEKLVCMKDHLFVDEYFKKLFPEIYLQEFSYNLDELFTM
jgi:hypothetical protein